MLQVLLSWIESERLILIQHLERGRSIQLSEPVVSFHSFLVFSDFLVFFVKNFVENNRALTGE